MSLTAGTRLGPYEIIAPLGAGGMGEVYRARDTTLNREVAIKVLPDSMAADPDRLARFRREAEALAALNHPNIAQVYGVQECRGPEAQDSSSPGVRAIVMELVEGPTLAERLEAGPLPLGETLAIARQIADAVDAAHARGIIHRDLKPANIKVKEDGTVKVLDFGLAKAVEPYPGTSGPLDPNNSPTLTARATQMGMILGTAAYMAPEQAKGKHVDERVDVWAFGVVLFEMLAGRRPFEGDDATEVMARVIDREPDWNALPPSTPGPIRRLLRRCLVKVRHDRLRDIGDARLEIADGESGVADDGPGDAQWATAGTVPGAWSRARPWVFGAVAVAATAVATWSIGTGGTSPPVRKVTIQLPADPNGSNGDYRILAISPDGNYVAAVLQQQLYVRPLGRTEALLIEGTDGAQSPFFSPDSQKIGFWADEKIKWTTVTGAPPLAVGPLIRPTDASWGDDGFIYASLWQGEIVRLPEAGGSPEVVFRGDSRSVFGPQLLPGGAWLLFTKASDPGTYDTSRIVAKSMTSDELIEVERGMDARATPEGHLLFVRDNVLFARRFDPHRPEVSGDPVPVVNGVRTTRRRLTGSAQYDIATDGTLVYLPGGGSRDATRLEWANRSGLREALLPVEALQIGDLGLELSPDGTTIAAHRSDLKEIWLFDVDRPGGRQLTTPGLNYPVWSYDSAWVFFADGAGLWKRKADLSGVPEAVELGPEAKPGFYFPSSASRDGKYLFINYSPEGTQLGLGRLSLNGDGAHLEMLVEPSSDSISGFASPSPDGRFVAYAAGPPFNSQIWMMEIATRRRIRISEGAGQLPKWTTPDEVVFMDGADVIAATVKTQPDLSVSSFRVLHRRSAFSAYDVTHDGRRFLHTVPPTSDGGVVNVSVVLNVFEDLKRLASGR